MKQDKTFHKKAKVKSKQDYNPVSGFFLAPSLFGVAVFFVIPFFVVVYFSFLDNSISKNFVGLKNYMMLFNNTAFQKAMGNTLIFSMIAVPLAVILSMGLAFLLDSGIPLKSQLRSFMLTPLMVPTASIVLIWEVLFDYKGVVNMLLDKIGASPVEWLKSSAGMLVIILLFLWKNLGYNMVLFLSAMGNIPSDMVEAAQLDGAGRFKIFWHIKLRYLSPMLVFTIVLSLINSFKVFREVYMLTGDYPVGSLYMLQHYMNNTFASADYQKLSTAAIYMCIVMIFIMALLFWIEHYFSKDLEEV